jgi:putative ABC transport system permease protein
METQELFRLSFHALVANKLRSFLTTLGIIIGVFAIIMLVSVGTGLQAYITNQIQGFGSNLIFVIPGNGTGSRTPGGVVVNKLLAQDAANIEIKLRNLAKVAPVVQQASTVKYKNKSEKGASILGTTSNYSETVKNATIEHGTFFSLSQSQSGANVAIIGQTLKEDLFPQTDPVGKRVFIGNSIYTVSGVLKKRGAVFGIDQDKIVIIPLAAARKQFGINQINAIYISANTESQITFIETQVKKVLLKRLTSDDFTVQSAESSLEIVGNITNILSLALGGIAAISLLVGGIGVANIMLVSVTERTREIGLRKALGAKRSDILKQFLLEAIMLSLTGGIIGIVIGLAGSLILAKLLVSAVTPWSVILAFTFSILIGVIFGMAPAIRASKLSPIEALRYE